MDCVVPKPQKPFTVEGMLISKKFRKFTKMVKPVFKLLSRRARTNLVTPSSCTYDVEECLQNQINESDPFEVEFQFLEDENARNEALERRLQESAAAQTSPAAIQTIQSGRLTLQPVIPGTYFAVPVHFIEAPHGGFVYVPADADFAPRPAATESQLPAQQVPCIVV